MKTFDVDVERRVSQIRTFPIAAETAEEAGRLALAFAKDIEWREQKRHEAYNVMHVEKAPQSPAPSKKERHRVACLEVEKALSSLTWNVHKEDLEGNMILAFSLGHVAEIAELVQAKRDGTLYTLDGRPKEKV